MTERKNTAADNEPEEKEEEEDDDMPFLAAPVWTQLNATSVSC